jgi:hypothetical protein
VHRAVVVVEGVGAVVGRAAPAAVSVRARNEAICARDSRPSGVKEPDPVPLATSHHTAQSMDARWTLSAMSSKPADGTRAAGQESSVSRALGPAAGSPAVIGPGVGATGTWVPGTTTGVVAVAGTVASRQPRERSAPVPWLTAVAQTRRVPGDAGTTASKPWLAVYGGLAAATSGRERSATTVATAAPSTVRRRW